jgi:hypothetical protein
MTLTVGAYLSATRMRRKSASPEANTVTIALPWPALRHVVYEGLREDKSPRDVRRTA